MLQSLSIRLDNRMISTAKFSDCLKYRYSLSRIWEPSLAIVNFIGLNPSTADHLKNDPTIHKCIRYARAWNYGGMHMTNLFAYRTPYPHEMMDQTDPVGPENDGYIKHVAHTADLVVAVWGNDGSFMERGLKVRNSLPNLHYLKLNLNGEPSHPRFLKKDLKPQPFNK